LRVPASTGRLVLFAGAISDDTTVAAGTTVAATASSAIAAAITATATNRP